MTSPSESETAAVGAPAGVDTGDGAPSSGSRLGRYVVLEEVGRGGMGRVLRAYDPKLEREVAIKLLASRGWDEGSTRRLVAEARAMAQLSNANVVAIYDVEATDDRDHMLVMEYVAGGSLRAWLRSGNHEWTAIVERFLAAGRGLAAAHAAGLLHRDFKPANVLLGTDDVVKVADFGLAKTEGGSISHDAGGMTSSGELTGEGSVLGTPRYMAPEQHVPTRTPMGPAADQYAFCVALWEALCGEAPFSGHTMDELSERKHAGPPAWPGVAVPRAISEAIRRGLAVDPAARWPDIPALLERLDPARQRRRTVGVLGVLGAAGLVAANAALWSDAGPPPCQDAHAQLGESWNEARRDRARTAILATGLPYAEQAWRSADERLEAYASRWIGMRTEACEATAVRHEQSPELMDLRMGCLHRARTVMRAVTDVLVSADVDVVENAAALVGDLEPLDRCENIEALQAAVEPPRPEDTEVVASIRADLATARAERVAGRLAVSHPHLEAARARAGNVDYAPLWAEVAVGYGLLLADLGLHRASEEALQDAVEWGSKSHHFGEVQEAASQLLYVVGNLQGRYDAAVGYRGLALGLADGKPTKEAGVHDHLASALFARGDYEDAEASIRRAIAIRETLPDREGEAAARNGLGIVLLTMGRSDEAEAEFRRILPTFEGLYGSVHPRVAATRNNLANSLYGGRRYEEAEAEYVHAQAIWEESLGPDHPRVAMAIHNTALVRNDMGRLEQAEAAYREAIVRFERAAGARHPTLVTFAYNLGNNLRDQGRHDDAEAEFARAVAIGEEVLGDDHPMLAIARTSLADMALQRGAAGVALAHATSAWDRNQRDDVAPAHRAWSAFVLARALWDTTTRTAERRRAVELARTALATYEAADAEYPERTKPVEDWLRGRTAG